MKKSLIILFLLLIAHSEAFGQWVQTNGPYGGAISCFGKHNNDLFAASNNSNGMIYNSNVEGQIFKSTDNGLSWFQTSLEVPQVSIVAIVSCGANIIAGSGNGIYLSSDDGNTWVTSDSGLTQPTVECLAVMGSIVIAGTSEGIIYRSFDSGKSWHPKGNGFTSAGLSNFCIMGSKILVESEQGIYFSTDSGANWQGSTNNSESLFAIQGSKIFAQCDSGIVVSTDTGKSWKIVDTSLFKKAITSIVVKDSNLFVGTYSGIFLSANDGLDWQEIDSSSTEITALIINDSVVLAGIGKAGVFRSTNNGASWKNTGVPEFAAIFLFAEGPNLYSNGYYGTLYVSSDQGKTWIPHLNDAATCMTSIGSVVISGNNSISIDSGNNWIAMNPIASSYASIALTANGSNLFSLTEIGVFLSLDTGASWTDISSGLGTLNDFNSLYGIAFNGPNIIAAGTNVYLSTDRGSDWTEVNSGVNIISTVRPGPASLVTCGSYLFVATLFGGVLRSSDNGTTWEGMNTGLPDSITISSLASRDNYIFAGSVGRGIFISSNFGETWTAMNSGLTDTVIFSLAVKDSTLYAGTGSSGVWRLSLSDLPTLSYILDVKNTENDTIFFDTIPVGGTSLRTVTAFNAGNGQLTIQPIQAPQNDFSTSDVSSPVILDSGESSMFEVYFQPTTPGLHSAQLNLLSEAKEVTIYLYGIATDEADVSDSNMQTDLLLSAYPNPLSQSTTISFTSAESGMARVTVVNLLGEEVARVFEGALTSGEHSWVWSKPTGLPAGMYECVVEMNGNTQQVPMAVTH